MIASLNSRVLLSLIGKDEDARILDLCKIIFLVFVYGIGRWSLCFVTFTVLYTNLPIMYEMPSHLLVSNRLNRSYITIEFLATDLSRSNFPCLSSLQICVIKMFPIKYYEAYVKKKKKKRQS